MVSDRFFRHAFSYVTILTPNDCYGDGGAYDTAYYANDWNPDPPMGGLL